VDTEKCAHFHSIAQYVGDFLKNVLQNKYFKLYVQNNLVHNILRKILVRMSLGNIFLAAGQKNWQQSYTDC
jgi:hypothetical protein